MKKNGSVEDDVLGWLASSQSDDAATYVSRGGSFGSLSTDELSSKWVASMRKMASDIRDYEAPAVTADLKSEFYLRSLEPPYALVRDEIATLAQALYFKIRGIISTPQPVTAGEMGQFFIVGGHIRPRAAPFLCYSVGGNRGTGPWTMIRSVWKSGKP